MPRPTLATDAPPMLTPRADCVAQVEGIWFVAEVQTGREQSLAWAHCDLGYGYYLPLVERVRVQGGIKRRKIVSLFPNYFFGCGDDSHRFCRDSRNVLNLLTVVQQRRLVNELSSLEIALFANPRLEVIDVHEVGQRVRVTGGRFEGVEGEVENFYEAKGMVRVIVRVNMLGKGTPLDIDRADLEPVS